MRKSSLFPKVFSIVAGVSLLLLFPAPVQAAFPPGPAFSQDGLAARGSLAASSRINWSSAVAVSPLCQPDPTRGAQLNDVAVNASGLAIAAWDQFTYATGGPYTVGVAIQSGGRWSAPFTISGTSGFSSSPKVAVGADGTLAVSWV